MATRRVRVGGLRLSGDDEIPLGAVFASTCLPHLHPAVEIEGEWYWAGGYSANPPLRQLIIDAKADDILLVQVTPETQVDVPRLSRDIARRVSQIAFNNPLQKEVEALADLRELCKKGRIFRSRLCRKLQRLRLHRIAAEDGVGELGQASALNLDWSFITQLKEHGYRAAEQWQASIPRH